MNGNSSQKPSATYCCSDYPLKVQCDSRGRVTSLNYAASLLSGAINSGLNGLSNLTSLNLSYNALTGSVPVVFGAMSLLTTMYSLVEQGIYRITPYLDHIHSPKLLQLAQFQIIQIYALQTITC